MEKYDVSDPSDWLDTRLTEFAPVDAALRCEVCKDYFNTPMITSCAHTFCSLCIRRALAADGKCPTCRSNDQASKLRRNGTVEELVEKFKAARPVALKLAQDASRAPNESTVAATSTSKRKAAEANIGDDEAERSSQKRKTRSQSRQDGLSQSTPIPVIDNEQDGDYQPEHGLAACPICNKRMKAEAVFSHLDHCEEEQEQDRRKRTRTRTPNSSDPSSAGATSKSSKPPERIAELSYGLLTEKALKKKLSELGIPAWGIRALLIRRHTEWVNLWNANADSIHPQSKRELLNQLDKWERTQGGHAQNPGGASNGPNGVMKKDFDGARWAKSNKSEFDKLIEEARRKPKQAEQERQGADSSGNLDDPNSRNTPEDAAFNGPDKAREPSKHPTASAPPPYLKHEESLERAKQKIHGSQNHDRIDHLSKLNIEEQGRIKQKQASESTFSPIRTREAEHLPMFKVQEHPVEDVDEETTVQ
ncbi:MAG: E3 ubiquitin-protein ligase rad18 [Bathelium mastoideum]|nr:MAG: E3 ubiquitin-protein ligase rad18 [Bathelium mastoideum]